MKLKCNHFGMTENFELMRPAVIKSLVLLVCISAVSVSLTAMLAAALSEGILKMDYKTPIF